MPTGTAGNDTLIGTAAADLIEGLAGNDVLSGLEGDDTLSGGRGNDTLTGGDGADRFFFSFTFNLQFISDLFSNLVTDLVTDFSVADGDKIMLSGAFANAFASDGSLPSDHFRLGTTALDANDFILYDVSTGYLYYDADGYGLFPKFHFATLQTRPSLSAEDFVYATAIIDGTGSNESLEGTDAADVINGLGGNDTIQGLGGNDIIDGGDGNDSLYGGNGDDTLDGGMGNDFIDGGSGTDTATYLGASAGIAANLVTGIVTGGAGNDTLQDIENLVGSAFDDTLTGDSSANELYGNAGDDTLDGGAGADTLAGGAGNDTYYVDDADDDIVELSGEGTDFVFSTASSYTLPDNVENAKLNASGTLAGNAQSNLLTGDTSNDTLRGMDGNDTLQGDGNDTNSGGNDLLYGGDGNDSIRGQMGDDTIYGGDGYDTLVGGEGNDLFVFDTAPSTNTNYDIISDFTSGADRIVLAGAIFSGFKYAGTLATLYTSDFPTDAAYIKKDGEYLYYDPDGTTGSTDPEKIAIVIGGNVVASDIIIAATETTGTSGNDGLAGNAGPDIIEGLAGNDSLSGLGGNDSLDGGDGDDVLRGGADDDTLEGGAGNDELSGGDGIDEATYLNAGGGVSVSLAITTAQNTLGAGIDTLVDIENLRGSEYNDTLVGDSNNNVLYGEGANDLLDGGAGSDTLYGGYGNDIFRFSTAPNGSTNVDTIADYESNDRLQFDNAVFTAFTALGTLNANFLVKAHSSELAPADADNYLLYETDTGKLYYDADGNGAAPRVHVATLLNMGLPVGNIPAGGIEIIGNAIPTNGADNLVGSSGHDSIDGLAGNDTIDGLAGNDTLKGGGGDDSLLGGTGNDILDGDDGNDELHGGDGDDILRGGNDDDKLDGGEGSDEIIGGDGDDRIMFSWGIDTIDGGAGYDTLDFTNVSGEDGELGIIDLQVNLNSSSAQNAGEGRALFLSNIEALHGGAGNDFLIGDAQNNFLRGGDGDDTLQGGDGNDELDGGDGEDIMEGGDGDDTYWVDNLNDIVNEDEDAGHDTIYLLYEGGLQYVLPPNIENLYVATDGAAVWLAGNELDNYIMLGEGAATIDGGAGKDTVSYLYTSLPGPDGISLNLNLSTQIPYAGAGTLTMSNIENLAGTEFNDTLIGDANANTLDGYEGDDSLVGGAGNDHFYESTGDDYIDGGDGIDTLNYSPGWSAVHVDLGISGPQTIRDGESDTIVNIENLVGTSYSDVLIGDGGDNEIQGLEGDDLLKGGAGADSLFGGYGNDTLEGGSGADSFFFTYAPASAGIDRISDFVSGTDRIVLDNSKFTSLLGVGQLSAAQFRSGAGVATAADADDYLIYNTTTGALYYDADGSGGSHLPIQIAVLHGEGAATLLHSDIEVIGAAHSTINGTAGNDSLSGTNGADLILGGDGDDTLDGGSGNDTINGGDGIDTVTYASSTDNTTVELGRGKAAKDGHGGSDTLISIENATGSALNDIIIGSNIANVLRGEDGHDIIDGLDGNDTLYGGDGHDHLRGGAGNDVLIGGNGVDTLVGGAGNDIFWFSPYPETSDVILDFAPGADKLRIESFGGMVNTIDASQFRLATESATSAHRIIYDNATGMLYLDSDGDGDDPALALVKLVGAPNLTYSDIEIYIVPA
jgi:Ca2+-binding RTX toxin-like protein